MLAEPLEEAATLPFSELIGDFTAYLQHDLKMPPLFAGAALALGSICAVLMTIWLVVWIKWCTRRMSRSGESSDSLSTMTATSSGRAVRKASEQIQDDPEHQQAWSISFRLAKLNGTRWDDHAAPDGQTLHELIEEAAALHHLTASKAGLETCNFTAESAEGPRIVCRITITAVDKATDPNLPSHFFPGCGSDGAEFCVTEGEFPSRDAIDKLLQAWDGDCYLDRYDSNYGRGYFTMLDCSAPEAGSEIPLHAPRTALQT
ncbi:hypothetical protein [Achromobacter aegrifaciens]|uniref:hypothetical protein n=1 Tax=Achromobacter aegrifaciens TaxID=1287736 RepID=UPI0028AC9003|nr:hypothetical protein [Achromobacter aegrifaciens]